MNLGVNSHESELLGPLQDHMAVDQLPQHREPQHLGLVFRGRIRDIRHLSPQVAFQLGEGDLVAVDLGRNGGIRAPQATAEEQQRGRQGNGE